LWQWKSAQAVVGAQRDDGELRLVGGEQGGEAGEAAGGGFAGDAGVDDAVGGFFVFQSFRQQRDPAGLARYAVGGG
jgi:hypothetical protein